MPASPTAIVFALAAALSVHAASAMTLASPDLKPGGRIADDQAFDRAGCKGHNVSPRLVWSGAPEGTKSFAVSMFDRDAPVAGGFWHWWAYDLPAKAAGLGKGAGTGAGLPPGARQARNDFGTVGYGGPCPPKGRYHRYVVTVYALDIVRLGVAADASVADLDAAVRSHALAKATLTGTYGRR